jgi:hypothetical protein
MNVFVSSRLGAFALGVSLLSSCAGPRAASLESSHGVDDKPKQAGSSSLPNPAPPADWPLDAYVRAHTALIYPPVPIAADADASARDGWRAAVAEAAERGDAFTLHLVSRIDRSSLAAADIAILDRAAETLRARGDLAASTPPSRSDLQRMLERAAWADLGCNPLEGIIVRWTIERLRDEARAPAVRAELEKLRADYRPSTDDKTRFDSMSRRVPSYLSRILELEPVQPATVEPAP